MDILTFLEDDRETALKPVYVVHGDEDFLKRRVLLKLHGAVLAITKKASGSSLLAGDKADFAEVRDELSTLGFLSERRLVQIDQADGFVTKFPAQLEKYVAEPSAPRHLGFGRKDLDLLHAAGQLHPSRCHARLQVSPGLQAARMVCPLGPLLSRQAMSTAAARLLVDLIGPEMGLLDQAAKLAAYVGSASKIEADDVNRLVGNSRTESTWKIFDSIGSGSMDEALQLLDKLLDQGEEPLKILGGFARNCVAWLKPLSYPPRGKNWAQRCSSWYSAIRLEGGGTATSSHWPADRTGLRLASGS